MKQLAFVRSGLINGIDGGPKENLALEESSSVLPVLLGDEVCHFHTYSRVEDSTCIPGTPGKWGESISYLTAE